MGISQSPAVRSATIRIYTARYILNKSVAPTFPWHSAVHSSKVQQRFTTPIKLAFVHAGRVSLRPFRLAFELGSTDRYELFWCTAFCGTPTTTRCCRRRRDACHTTALSMKTVMAVRRVLGPPLAKQNSSFMAFLEAVTSRGVRRSAFDESLLTIAAQQ